MDLKQLVFVLAVITCWITGCDTPVDQPEIISDVQKNVGHKHRHLHGNEHFHDHDHSPEFSGIHEHEHFHQHRHDASPRSGELIGVGHRIEDGRRIHSHIEVMPLAAGKLELFLLHDTDNPVDQIADSFAADIYAESKLDSRLATVVFVRLASSEVSEVSGQDARYVALIPEELESLETLVFRVEEMLFGDDLINFDFEFSVK